MSFRFSPLLILLTLAFLSCAVTGPGGKKSIIIIPTSQEVAIGVGMDEEIRKTEKILDDSLWQDYITEIGQKIVNVSDRKDLKYHFAVIESDQINAFAAPGGYLYFYTGIIKEMKNEAELASVVAHEISHVVARHSIKRVQAAMGVSLVSQLILGDNNSKIIQTAIGTAVGLKFASYSRDNEREADNFGLNYMIAAGYHPNGMVSMFKILAEKGGKTSNVFEQLASSHPDTQERINNTKKDIQTYMPLKSDLTFGEEHFQKMKERLK